MTQAGVDYIGVGVGGLILDEDNRIFIAQRGPLAKNEQGKWEIPGGSVEFGETFSEALIREIREEIGVVVEVGELLQLSDHLLPDEQQHWISPSFFCKIVQGEPKIMEPGKTIDFGWFTLEEAEQLG